MVPSKQTLLLTSLFFSCFPLLAQDAGNFAPPTLSREEAKATMKRLPANGIVPLKTIAGDFAANEVAAAAKYSGHRITVVGRIASLGKGSGENTDLVVTLQDASGNLPPVKAKFNAGFLPQNSEIEISADGSQATLLKRDRSGMILGRQTYLSVDQRLGITGDFKEIHVGDIVLTGCKLASKAKLRQAEKHFPQ
jgi:tRNA_anti-like